MSDKALINIWKNYHHGVLRSQLLEAVRGLFEEHRPDGFSITDACRLAGVSTAEPYKPFSDRHEIMRGAVVVQRVAAEHMGIPFDHPEAKLRAYSLWCFVHGRSFCVPIQSFPTRCRILRRVC